MTDGQVTRRVAALSGLISVGAPALALAAPQPNRDFASGAHGQGLLTAPVMIDGQGPFSFAIDSAANASVIAQDLAIALGLPDAGEVAMHTVVARETAKTVRAGRLQTGALNTRDARLVVAGRDGMDGLDGLLGTDLLANLRLVLRFGRRAGVSVSRPQRGREHGLVDARLNARSSAEQRFNGLLLVDALADRTPCKAIIDTGAKVTVINAALARQTGAEPALPGGPNESRVYSPTGRAVAAQAMVLPALRFGGFRVRRVPVLLGDLHTFALWGLVDQPGLLLGVDVLSLFHTVIIDLKRGELLLDL